MSTILVNNVKSYTGSTVTISGSNIAVQGNTTLGDNSGVDTIKINGHITASGNISASGTVFASNFKSAGASGEAMTFNDNVDLDGTFTMDGATFDVNATGAVTIDSVGLSIDNAGVAANITSTTDGAGEDFTIALAGATDSSLVISSTGTGADAINIDTTAGSIDIDSADNITVSAADNISIQTTSANGELILSSSHTAGQAIHINATANAGSIVDIDAGILDIDVTGAATIDSVGLSIDNAGVAANITSTSDGAAEDFTIALAGATDSSLILSSTGTAADALQIKTTAGGIDITATGNAAGEDIDISSAASVNITATENAANSIYLRANGGTSETIKIHSDQGTGVGSVELTSDAGSIDINAGDNITMDAADNISIQTTSADGLLNLSSSHVAGQAIHINATANAGSIVDIDAGILDIDVTGAATIDAASLVITGPVTAATGVQSTATALTATDAGVAIPVGTAVALINADSDANHIVILPAPVVGNIIHIIETAATGYELRSSTPGSIGINGGTGSNVESAIAGAITYIRCVCVSSTSWIATQFDADGDESKVEAAA